MSALEKFKRRLVRDIARRQYVEGQPEDEMWDQLKIEYGCDCFLLWQHMKVLTSKKLKRMLAAEDRMECITRVARMTSTDWLTFDLVLVHQDVDVIGEELIQNGKPESPVLEILFDLVMSHNIENSSGDRLVAKWAALTKKYNTRGRECSAMLLQRRWYQLKDLSRRRLYEFWMLYRGNPRNLAKAIRPTKLQIRISERLPNLITKKFVQWKDLLESGKIVQAVQFESRRRKMESNAKTDDPDLVVIEPHIETIEVAADSEDEVEQENGNKDIEIDENTEDSITPMEDNEYTSKTAENSPKPTEHFDASDSISNLKVSVKNEPTEVLEINDTLSDNEPVETDNMEDTEEASVPEHVKNDPTYPEYNTVLPKITNIMGNVDMIESNEKCYPINHDSVTNEILSDSEDPPIESDIAPSINSEDSNKSFEENVDKKLPFSSDDVIDLHKLPSTLQFVDDGIEFVDDDEDNLEEKPDANDDDEMVNLDDVDPSYGIDRKLIMIPITYTKKLDDMDILKNIGYSMLKGKDLIELVEAESRTIKLNSENIKTEVETEYEQIDETAIEGDREVTKNNGEIDEARSQDYNQVNDETTIVKSDSKQEGIIIKSEKQDIDKMRSEDDAGKREVPRVKYTSWLLQKPKHRNYNPILLCKNPDFNTRLKRLSAGFFLSERNRRLFNACKPLTIDMHKAFETKLVNNVLYLENTTIPNFKQEKVTEVCENTASVIPSAVAVQSLLDITRVEQKDFMPEKLQMDEPKPSPSHEHKVVQIIERGHVINEPLMSPTVRADENLLKADMSSVAQLSNPVSENKPAQSATLNTWHNPIYDKKNKKAKTKPLPPVPKWSNYGSSLGQYEESLITKDTLAKVICFLDTGTFQLPKKSVSVEATKKLTTKEPNPPPPPIKATSNKTINLTNENELNSKQNMILENSKVHVPKRKRNKKPQTIAVNSGFCCWCRHRIEILRPENQNITSIRSKKYRHLCPLVDCNCCCQQDLLDMMKSHKLVDDHTYSRDGEIPEHKEPETTVKVTRDIAIQAISIQNENGQMEIKSAIELYHPQNKNVPKNAQGTITLDVVTSDSNDYTSNPLITYAVTHSSVSTQFEYNYVIATQSTHASSNTCDTDSQTSHAKTGPPIKTNIIPARPHRGNKAEVFSVTSSAGWQSATSNIVINKNIVQNAVIETISLIEEEVDSPPNQTSNSPQKGLLPQGVNILLLPDNTLSVSIEPGVQIDPASLSKLPEILSVVQKKLLESGILNKKRKLPTRKWKHAIRKEMGTNFTSRNTVVNDPTIKQLDPQITEDNEYVEMNAVNPGVNVVQENAELNILNTEVNVNDDNAELIVMGPEVEVTEENAQLHILTPEVNITDENAELIAMGPEEQVTDERAQLHILSPETDVEKKNVELNLACSEVLSIEENAELIVMNPKEPVAQENTEPKLVSPEVDDSEETVELNLISPEVHFTEENSEHLDAVEVNISEKSADLNVISTEQNAGDAQLNIMNGELMATQANVEVNVVDAELKATQENTGLNLQYSNTNVDLNTAETNPILHVARTDLESKVANTEENVRKGDEDILTYTDYIVKVAPETSRKSILSDLMTMSGISTEDTNMSTECPVINNVTTGQNTHNIINNVIPTNVINYNLPDNPYFLTNTHNIGGNIQIVPPPKKVKKVMVFIKKRLKKKPTLDSSVIDLTEDNDKPDDPSKQNDPQMVNMQKEGNNCQKILNLKRAKLIRVPAAAVPPKIYRAAQSLLRKDNSVPVQNNTTFSPSDIEKQMKIHLARHYRQLNRKPTILDILKNIKNSKAMPATPNTCTESDSSDDEPLAKKSRRMRTENTDSNSSLVPIEQYNLPVEFNTNEPVAFFPAADGHNSNTNADNQDSDTNVEDSILGI
ncbi:uncharacterized protein LOC106718779 [Papilio machaon]|uniref:uncharacterized protein LOC106718779 n=1 Tax=Papilio machaon TaxID=76193 RepID=UPI001E663906|nr:uncharacterized protein LOC106718779 [Papilio machaon]XP_014368439.2 uncharacterized protein LOC106718779 [Papilio machaon]